MTASTLPKQKPSWPLLMLGVGLIALVISLAALYNLAYLGDEALIRSYSQRLKVSTNEAHQEQLIFAAPAKIVNLQIQAGKSIKGLWSTDTLDVVVSDSDTGSVKAEAAITKEKSWDANIQHNAIFERRDPIFVSAAFTLSSDAPIGGELAGNLNGRITFPVISAAGEQEDQTADISFPFRVKVVSPEEIARKVRTQAKTTLSIAAPIALILIGIPLAYFRKHRKSKQPAKSGKSAAGK